MGDFCFCGRLKTKEIDGKPYCDKHDKQPRNKEKRDFSGISKTPFSDKYLE
jgi:hypothetical protein